MVSLMPKRVFYVKYSHFTGKKLRLREVNFQATKLLNPDLPDLLLPCFPHSNSVCTPPVTGNSLPPCKTALCWRGLTNKKHFVLKGTVFFSLSYLCLFTQSLTSIFSYHKLSFHFQLYKGKLVEWLKFQSSQFAVCQTYYVTKDANLALCPQFPVLYSITNMDETVVRIDFDKTTSQEHL